MPAIVRSISQTSPTDARLAVGAERHAARMRLGVSEQLGKAGDRQARRSDEHERRLREPANRNEIANGVVRHTRLQQACGNDVRQSTHQQRISVGRGTSDQFGGDRAARAAAILDGYRRAQQDRQRLGGHPCERVGRVTRRLADDDPDRPAGKRVGASADCRPKHCRDEHDERCPHHSTRVHRAPLIVIASRCCIRLRMMPSTKGDAISRRHRIALGRFEQACELRNGRRAEQAHHVEFHAGQHRDARQHLARAQRIAADPKEVICGSHLGDAEHLGDRRSDQRLVRVGRRNVG
jgi:hypothetical protein